MTFVLQALSVAPRTTLLQSTIALSRDHASVSRQKNVIQVQDARTTISRPALTALNYIQPISSATLFRQNILSRYHCTNKSSLSTGEPIERSKNSSSFLFALTAAVGLGITYFSIKKLITQSTITEIEENPFSSELDIYNLRFCVKQVVMQGTEEQIMGLLTPHRFSDNKARCIKRFILENLKNRDDSYPLKAIIPLLLHKVDQNPSKHIWHLLDLKTHVKYIVKHGTEDQIMTLLTFNPTFNPKTKGIIFHLLSYKPYEKGNHIREYIIKYLPLRNDSDLTQKMSPLCTQLEKDSSDEAWTKLVKN